MKRTRVFFLVTLLTGCAGLIGVPDLELDESAGTKPDGSTPEASIGDATVNPQDARPDVVTFDAGPFDAGPPPLVDSATCDLSAVATDPENCGRCGHSCLGSACNAGRCEKVALGRLPTNGYWASVIEHGAHLYAATSAYSTPVADEGIYKIEKATGTKVQFVKMRNTQQPVILGETLYFNVYDYTFDDAGYYGGLYSCGLAETPTCTPKLLAPAERPYALAGDKGKVFFTEVTNYQTLEYTPDAGPDASLRTVATLSYADDPYQILVDAPLMYFLNVLPARVAFQKLTFVATSGTALSEFQSANPSPGEIRANATDVFYTAKDFEDGRAGVVKRLSRATGSETCEYAKGDATSVDRPDGLYIDANRIYWTNRGDFAPPHLGGSIASCEIGGCCTKADILATNPGEPTAITGDDQYLYWVTYTTGEVFKVAKP